MMFKKSRYNILIDDKKFLNQLEKEEYPIFNTYTGSFGAMNETINSLYKTSDSFNFDEIKDGYVKAQMEIMLSNGFLVDADVNEVNRVKCVGRLTRYDNSTLSLTIAPTLDCNMDCPYCFEQKNGHVMSEKTQNGIIDYIKKRVRGILALKVFWYGGEPLLEVGIIKDLSKELIKLCEENNISFSASITTNGYLLTEKVAKVLANDCKIGKVQITIDGYREMHDIRRCLKNGESSFDSIVYNAETASKYLLVTVRSNVDKYNTGNIRTLIDYLILERNWISKENLRIYFSPVTDVQNTNAHNGCHSWSGFADIHESLIEYLYQIRAYKEIEFSIPTPMYYACGALTSGSIVIDPDGDIYKCYEVIGQKKYAVGDIFSGQKFDDNLMKWLLLDTLPECDDCIFLPMCQSACPLDRLTNNSKNCHHVKKSYKKPLEKAYLIHSGAVNGEFI